MLNKQDLKQVVTKDALAEKLEAITRHSCKMIPISAKNEKGMELLETEVKNMFYQGNVTFNDQVFITNLRHKEAIIEGLESLEQVKESIACHMPEDFYSIDLMQAYESLGRIIGESVEEDLVNKIFKEFCMGK